MAGIDRRHLRHIDFTLVFSVVALCMIGIMTIRSASITQGSRHYDIGQWRWISIGIVLMLVTLLIPYRKLVEFAWLPYLASVVSLVVVLLMPGRVKRWIPLGPFRFQPSEFAKISVVLFLAWYLGRANGQRLTWRRGIIATLIVLLPMGLIVKEPDLGTSLVLLPILAAILVICGLNHRVVATVGGLAVAGMTFVYSGGLRWLLGHAWALELLRKFLKDYQIARIIGFPGEPTYQVVQAQIGIGSGGLWGKGYLLGTQSRLHFIPEHHTDFIFSVFAEEWGFVGCAVLLGIYFVLLWRGLQAARGTRVPSGRILATGATVILATQIIVNISMVVGLLPVTGLPLPFLTYGGSALMMSLILVGLVLNVGMRRFDEYDSSTRSYP